MLGSVHGFGSLADRSNAGHSGGMGIGILTSALLLAGPVGGPADAQADSPVLRNVRIVVTGTSERTSRQRGVEAAGSGAVGGIRIGGGRLPPETGVVVRGRASQSQAHDQTRQELLVMSGGRAEIAVSEELPYQQWFQTWGYEHGLWQPGLAWKEVGARMVVEPTAVDDRTLRIRVTPAFSYVVDRQTVTTAVSQLSTEVLVRVGQEIDLGGIPMSDRQFLEKFLVGFDEYRETSRLRITLRASIE